MRAPLGPLPSPCGWFLLASLVAPFLGAVFNPQQASTPNGGGGAGEALLG